MSLEQPAVPTLRSAAEVGAEQLPAVLGGFDLSDQDRFTDGFPHEVFARLRKEAPVLRHPPGRTRDGEDFWVLSRYDDVVEAAEHPSCPPRAAATARAAAPTSTTCPPAPTPARCST